MIIVIFLAAVWYSNLLHSNTSEPNFQLSDVDISNPTLREQSNLIFDGYVQGSCSFYYTAKESATYRLMLQNPNSPKSLILTRYDNGLELVENLNIAPYATYPRSYELLKGETFSGSLEISGGDGVLLVGIHYDNYTQSVGFSAVLSNTGSLDGYVVVELRSDGTPIWSGRYFLASGGGEKFSGMGNVSDKEEHVFDLVIVQQGS